MACVLEERHPVCPEPDTLAGGGLVGYPDLEKDDPEEQDEDRPPAVI